MQLENILDDLLEDYEIEGEACELELDTEIDISENKKLVDAIRESIGNMENDCEWISEDDMEEETLKNVPASWIYRRKNE